MTFDPLFSSELSPPPPPHRTIAFTSGKGGVGKFNVVLNTGLTLARRGRRVAILDGDLGLASINVLLGVSPRYDLRHVVAGERSLEEVTLRGPHGLLIVPAGSGVAELANLGPAEREDLLDELRALGERVDFLLIDTGAGLSDTVLNLIVSSDEAVVVTRPEPTALADAYALMKVVIQHDASYPFHLLVNMVRDVDQARQVFDALSQILVRFLGYRPGYAGHVVADASVGQAVVRQVPFTTLSPRSPAAACIEQLADALTATRETARAPAVDAPPADSRTFWEKVSRWTWSRP
jgi:flagellar biosynthesis protein FlhG